MDEETKETVTEPDVEGVRPRRYSLADLLQGAETLPGLYEGTEGCLDGPPVGREAG